MMAASSRVVRAATATVAVAAFVAGCSTASTPPSASRTTPKPTSTTATSAPTTSTTAAAAGGPSTAPGSASPALSSAVVRLSDLPAGWRATPSGTQHSDDTTGAATARCVGTKDTTSDRTSQAQSDTFTKGSVQVTSNAERFRSHQDVAADVAILRSPKIDRCVSSAYHAAVERELPPGVAVGAITLHVSPGSHGGPAAVAGTASGHVTVSSQGRRTTVYLALGFIAGTRTEADVEVSSLGAPVPGSLLAPLLRTVAARVR